MPILPVGSRRSEIVGRSEDELLQTEEMVMISKTCAAAIPSEVVVGDKNRSFKEHVSLE